MNVGGSEQPLPPLQMDRERDACIAIDPVGFHLKPPPSPHHLKSFITPDEDLFETIHMGAAVVDHGRWRLVIDGDVERPFAIDLGQLRALPSRSVTAFHECYGSPLKPPVENLWRIGNVTWTGVPLADLLRGAQPKSGSRFVWSEGLDRGSFAGRTMDRYQKDLPIERARQDDVLLAYAMNGRPLRKERGGPVRLVVPGWFGTNMTKWLCRISVRRERAPGPFTTTWYNDLAPDPDGASRPVWEVPPNSMIVAPEPNARLRAGPIRVQGWAWSGDGVRSVALSGDAGTSWSAAAVTARTDASWQRFSAVLELPEGRQTLTARATAMGGDEQPMAGGRNHVHAVSFVCER